MNASSTMPVALAQILAECSASDKREHDPRRDDFTAAELAWFARPVRSSECK